MTRPLSNLVNNLAEAIHKTKCKYGHDDKKCEKLVKLNIEITNVFLNTQALEMI